MSCWKPKVKPKPSDLFVQHTKSFWCRNPTKQFTFVQENFESCPHLTGKVGVLLGSEHVGWLQRSLWRSNVAAEQQI